MSKGVDIFWSCGEENEELVSFVPGVSERLTRNKNMPSSDVKNSKKGPKPASPQKKFMTSKSADQKLKDSKRISTKGHRASLKDLCAEDKERVANLIRELSKTSEEKEATQQQLGEAKKIFSHQLKQIKAEKIRIEKEQKMMVAQYQDCQKLLAFYQSKLSEQQKEVSNDINKLLTKAEKAVTPTNAEGQHINVKNTSPSDSVNHRDITIRELDDEIESVPLHDNVLGESYCQTVDPVNNSRSPSSKNYQQQYKVAAVQTMDQVKPTNTLDEGAHISRAYQKRSDDFAREFLKNMRRDDQSSVTTDTDEQARELAFDFGNRLRSMSPTGRRDELLRQKEELEEEQFHLQKLLAEQEEQLRRRHRELKDRHVHYMDRMKHFRYKGKFPSVDGEFPSSRDLSYDLNIGHDYDTEPIRGQGLANSMRHMTRRRPTGESIGLFGETDGDETSSYFHDRKSEPSTRYTSMSKSNPNTTYKSSLSLTNRPRHAFTTSLSDDVIDVVASSPRRPHNSTMNNLSDLSQLVDDTEAITSLSRDVTTAMRVSATSDVMHKSTFDPEDSELLEDIFFIK